VQPPLVRGSRHSSGVSFIVVARLPPHLRILSLFSAAFRPHQHRRVKTVSVHVFLWPFLLLRNVSEQWLRMLADSDESVMFTRAVADMHAEFERLPKVFGLYLQRNATHNLLCVALASPLPHATHLYVFVLMMTVVT